MSEASPEERKKIIDALENGRTEFSEAGKEFFHRAGGISSNPDFTVVSADVTDFWGPWSGKEDPVLTSMELLGNNGGMEISWSTVSAGFGTLTVCLERDGRLKIDSEGMGKDFCKEVFAKLVENSTLDL